jgi:hypothetical protein
MYLHTAISSNGHIGCGPPHKQGNTADVAGAARETTAKSAVTTITDFMLKTKEEVAVGCDANEKS